MAELRVIHWETASAEERRRLLGRGGTAGGAPFPQALRTSIAALVDDVRERGDAALLAALARFDGVEARLRAGVDRRQRRAGAGGRPRPGDGDRQCLRAGAPAAGGA